LQTGNFFGLRPDSVLRLNTHLQPIADLPGGKEVIAKLFVFSCDSIFTIAAGYQLV
jgi:hypothetical protein